ncbi:MAG: DoxX family membrane protein [Cellulomonadaceae bacterium]|jgi:uncharacterized membrane protein YphA (DoxX/SURF4 family)|nr:DoxX family membrane protein [Cellulomonadaceae bacterium]
MLLRRFARILFAAPFIQQGTDAVMHPSDHAATARPLIDSITDKVGIDPLSDAQLRTAVRVHGGLTAVLGTTLALGIFPRISSLKLAALTAPLVALNQPFTVKGKTEDAKAERAEKTAKFAQSLGLVGAALIAGADLEGRPGVKWRVNAAREARAANLEQ